jgi:hypothetical protein
MIVMDMSGSMYGNIGDTLKIHKARHAASQLLSSFNTNTVAGLEIVGGTKRRGCKNFGIVVPLQRSNNDTILSHIKKIKPRGKTPLAYALKEAADALQYTHPTATMVLISDGRERCGSYACDMAKKLKSQHKELRIDTISLATDPKAKANLQCISTATGGRYFNPDQAYTSHNASPMGEHSKKNPSKTIKPMLKLYAALPRDDENGIAAHQVYDKNGTLILECSSTQNSECIEPISVGKYTVTSTYNNTIHETKLYVLQGADALLYTSFRAEEQASKNEEASQEEPRELFETENDIVNGSGAEEMMINEERKREAFERDRPKQTYITL